MRFWGKGTAGSADLDPGSERARWTRTTARRLGRGAANALGNGPSGDFGGSFVGDCTFGNGRGEPNLRATSVISTYGLVSRRYLCLDTLLCAAEPL
jgi:hypothetical protein